MIALPLPLLYKQWCWCSNNNYNDLHKQTWSFAFNDDQWTCNALHSFSSSTTTATTKNRLIIQMCFTHFTIWLTFSVPQCAWAMRLEAFEWVCFSVCTSKVRIVNNTLAFRLVCHQAIMHGWFWSGHRQDLSKTICLNISHINASDIYQALLLLIAHLPMQFISLVGCLDC